MNSEQFCYWLKGYFELSNTTPLTLEQTEMIKEHLRLVFGKVTKNTLLKEFETSLVKGSNINLIC